MRTDVGDRYILNFDAEVGSLVHDDAGLARLWDVENLLFGVCHGVNTGCCKNVIRGRRRRRRVRKGVLEKVKSGIQVQEHRRQL